MQLIATLCGQIVMFSVQQVVAKHHVPKYTTPFLVNTHRYYYAVN